MQMVRDGFGGRSLGGLSRSCQGFLQLGWQGEEEKGCQNSFIHVKRQLGQERIENILLLIKHPLIKTVLLSLFSFPPCLLPSFLASFFTNMSNIY